jgi:hypothetical protein
MIDLIKRLEALEAPCRECDAEIALAKGWTQFKPNWYRPPDLDIHHHFSELPRYTASIDAAMTLVPEGDFDQDWSRSTRCKSEGFKLWQVRIAFETVDQDPEELGPVALGEHDIPAIALCIAALRAQEASHDGR